MNYVFSLNYSRIPLLSSLGVRMFASSSKSFLCKSGLFRAKQKKLDKMKYKHANAMKYSKTAKCSIAIHLSFWLILVAKCSWNIVCLQGEEQNWTHSICLSTQYMLLAYAEQSPQTCHKPCSWQVSCRPVWFTNQMISIFTLHPAWSAQALYIRWRSLVKPKPSALLPYFALLIPLPVKAAPLNTFNPFWLAALKRSLSCFAVISSTILQKKEFWTGCQLPINQALHFQQGYYGRHEGTLSSMLWINNKMHLLLYLTPNENVILCIWVISSSKSSVHDGGLKVKLKKPVQDKCCLHHLVKS